MKPRALGRRQAGLSIVEFAISAAALLIVMFGCLEVARLLFVWNSLAEGTRRGARMAAICPPNDVAVQRATILNLPDQGDDSAVIAGLDVSMVQLTYLDSAGGSTADPAKMAYVRASISGYSHALMVPFVSLSIPSPTFATTVPTESLGYVPGAPERSCPGT